MKIFEFKNRKFFAGVAAMLLTLGLLTACKPQPEGPEGNVKIGFVTTLTTPAAVIGEDMQKAVNLAVEHLDGKMANKQIEVIFEDDGFKPETGKQKTDKLLKQDGVDFLSGYIWSNVLMASRKSAVNSGKFLISANAGPAKMAGEQCHKNFFSTSWQNDQTPQALGTVLNDLGVDSLYLMAPNYVAGKDVLSGVKETFKGDIVGQDLTKWGKDTQLDFSAELAKAEASGAAGLMVFYPGKAGGAFMKQYQQAGLQDSLPLYTVFTLDSLSLPNLQAAGIEGVLNSRMTMFWSPDLDVPANQKFVKDFKQKYGSYPSFYAAQSYDSIMLINHAVEAVDGDLADTDGMRLAMESAGFDSVRGAFTYGNNHFPIQNFYLREVVEDADGVWTTRIVNTVLENHQDSYASRCKLKLGNKSEG